MHRYCFDSVQSDLSASAAESIDIFQEPPAIKRPDEQSIDGAPDPALYLPPAEIKTGKTSESAAPPGTDSSRVPSASIESNLHRPMHEWIDSDRTLFVLYL